MASTDIANLLEMGEAGFGENKTSAIVPNNTTGVVVKAAPGIVFDIYCSNTSSTASYVKLYDTSSAALSTDTPILRFQVPPVASGGALNWQSRPGVFFANGISYRVTTGIADNDTGSPAATTYLLNIGYK